MRKVPRKFLALYTALFLVGVVILRIQTYDESNGISIRQASQVVNKNIPRPPPPQSKAFEVENFTCIANGSHEVITPNFFEPLKEFMRYRHCRRFPTLLRPTPCEEDLYLLFIIKSMASQVERRAALRNTWARAGKVLGHKVKLVFLMARPMEKLNNNNLQPVLRWENYQYGDILQWDFDDMFYNLTLKELGFLNWFASSCSSAQFVFKGDDDMFVHTRNIVRLLETHKPETPMLTGFIFTDARPLQEYDEKTIKYFIPDELYPHEKLYPPFMSGGGYLMSRQTVLDLNKTSASVPRFPLDDVYVGMILEKMGLKLTHHEGFMTFGFKHADDFHKPCSYQKIMVLHKLTPGQLQIMWALLQDKNLNCEEILNPY